jgi:hypothetical protein
MGDWNFLDTLYNLLHSSADAERVDEVHCERFRDQFLNIFLSFALVQRM